jgi:hypothetical protein
MREERREKREEKEERKWEERKTLTSYIIHHTSYLNSDPHLPLHLLL